jgi:hypothetical protein
MLQMKNKIHPIYKILLIVMSLGGLYFYYKYIRGFYDTVIIEDLSKNESYVADEPSHDMYYNFMWIKIEGELYGETDLVIKNFCRNVEHPGYPDYRDSVVYHFNKQGKLDTLIHNDWYCASQFTFHNIPKPKAKGYLKAKIHLGGFL